MGNEQPNADDWATLFVISFEKQHMEELFEAHGWEGEASGVVGLRLSPDNTKIGAARLLLGGSWGEGPVTIQAQKIWPTAGDNLVLEIAINDMSMFKFPEVEMASNYVAGNTTKHVMKTTSQDGSVWLTTNILVFPGTVASLVDKSPLALKASWPGIKMAEGGIILRPQAGRAREAMKGKAWGCPIGPAIVPGVPWMATPGPLEAAEERRAIGSLLNEGVLPDASLSAEEEGRRETEGQAAQEEGKNIEPRKEGGGETE